MLAAPSCLAGIMRAYLDQPHWVNRDDPPVRYMEAIFALKVDEHQLATNPKPLYGGDASSPVKLPILQQPTCSLSGSPSKPVKSTYVRCSFVITQLLT
jgi:hypothetical protein